MSPVLLGVVEEAVGAADAAVLLADPEDAAAGAEEAVALALEGAETGDCDALVEADATEVETVMDVAEDAGADREVKSAEVNGREIDGSRTSAGASEGVHGERLWWCARRLCDMGAPEASVVKSASAAVNRKERMVKECERGASSPRKER